MKFFLITVCLIFTALSGVSARAQTTPTVKKIGVIDTRFFLNDKTGIKKYVDAINAVDNEFKGAAAEMDGIAIKIQNLEKELKTFQEQAQKGGQINQTVVNAKLEEYDKLSREYKFKKEDNEAKYNRRQVVLVLPVQQDISKALQEFTIKNGFVILLDISKDRTGLILAVSDTADVTKEFIAFYNARPATAAVTK